MTPDAISPDLEVKGRWHCADPLVRSNLQLYKQEATACAMNGLRCPASRLEPNAAKHALKHKSTLARACSLWARSLWSQIYTRSWVGSQVAWPGLIKRQLLRDRGEQLLDVRRCFSRGLEEQKSRLSSVCLCIGCLNGPLVWLFVDNIGFVSGECDDDVLVCLSL